jgi:hypothetical protein
VIVAWLEEYAEPVEISLTGKPWRVVDLQGNELETNSVILTERPVYFVAEGTGLREMPL